MSDNPTFFLGCCPLAVVYVAYSACDFGTKPGLMRSCARVASRCEYRRRNLFLFYLCSCTTGQPRIISRTCSVLKTGRLELLTFPSICINLVPWMSLVGNTHCSKKPCLSNCTSPARVPRLAQVQFETGKQNRMCRLFCVAGGWLKRMSTSAVLSAQCHTMKLAVCLSMKFTDGSEARV